MKRMVYLNSLTRKGIRLAVVASFYASDEEAPDNMRIFRYENEIYALKRVTAYEDIIDTPNYVYIFRGDNTEIAAARNKIEKTNLKILIEEYIDDHIFPQNVSDYDIKGKDEDTQRERGGSPRDCLTTPLYERRLVKRGWKTGMVLIALCLTVLFTWWAKGTLETKKTAMVSESSRWLADNEIQTLISDLLMAPSVGSLYEIPQFEAMASAIANHLLTTDLGMEECDRLAFQVGCNELEESAAAHFHPGEQRICVKSMEHSGERMFYIIAHETYHSYQYELVSSIQERINDGQITIEDVTNPIIKAWMEDFDFYKSIDKDGIEAYRSQQIEKSAYRFSESMLAYYKTSLSSN